MILLHFAISPPSYRSKKKKNDQQIANAILFLNKANKLEKEVVYEQIYTKTQFYSRQLKKVPTNNLFRMTKECQSSIIALNVLPLHKIALNEQTIEDINEGGPITALYCIECAYRTNAVRFLNDLKEKHLQRLFDLFGNEYENETVFLVARSIILNTCMIINIQFDDETILFKVLPENEQIKKILLNFIFAQEFPHFTMKTCNNQGAVHVFQERLFTNN